MITNENQKIKTVLVTGGGGFLGKAIVKKLVKNNIEVTSFSRHLYPDLDQMGVIQIQGDLADGQAVAAAVSGKDTVFHVAAKPGLWGPYQEYYTANVIGTENVIAACKAGGMIRLVHTSSPSVVFDDTDMEGVDESVPYPKSYLAPYPETKAIAEKKVVRAGQEGLPVIILRPHLIWGPGDNHVVPGIISRARRLKIVGRTDDLVDTIYVDNAADAHILAAQALIRDPALAGNIYFISQDEPVSKWEMANAFLKAAGLPPIRSHVSAKTAYAAGWILEWSYKLLGIQKEPPMTRFAAKELATSHWFDISRAKKDLGYSPAVSTQQGLEYLAQWLAGEGGHG